ncbi:MAG TPA: 2-oxoglutarate dehydrogenase E1 component [Phycisphaerales bacterium]|nr:2-oxoglutarate dehydrogenase E1 component [Phycisphaerales bacterium]HMP36074.1 2-oxoglutarate dehydrogenase E1 component [Phycisphaerales bacterium]
MSQAGSHPGSPTRNAQQDGGSVNGWNGEYVEELHRRWLADPGSVDPQWQQFFRGFDLAIALGADRRGGGAAPIPSPAAARTEGGHRRQERVDELIYQYRDIGHLAATLDPLGSVRPFPEELMLESLELTEADLDERFDPGDLPLDAPATLRSIVELMEDTYCRSIGVEYMHIQDRERRRWLQRRMEGTRNRPQASPELKRRLLEQLARADTFENFLANRFVGKKRFGLEGGESLIAMLDQFLELAPPNGVQEYALGMAHRGRLNVLVNIVGKTYAQVFTEFEEAWIEDFVSGGGDVKYHQGYSGVRTTGSGHPVQLTLAANPSHLEFISSVVLGRTRARQRLRDDGQREAVIPVLIHGDAAFPGQGVVAECLNLMRLEGYTVGGSLHLVINNQVGFTTDPRDGFSGRHYCTDIAKMVDAPIFHVNGDDPEACAWVARLALEYRQAFHNDVVIDMLCYRKHGHNETDEPMFTQPTLYRKIKAQTPVFRRYAEQLVAEGFIGPEDVEALAAAVSEQMDVAQSSTKERPVDPTIDPFSGRWAGFVARYSFDQVHTAVERPRLVELSNALGRLPAGHSAHRNVERLLEYRRTAVERDEPIDWAMGEMLAYASLLSEGHAVRLTGQDVKRGTFSHRHAVIFDQESGEPFVALSNLGPQQARFCVHNSPLTEAACVGFEYGYSLTDPKMLILWEAQFGDFANGAQVIIDQFIASAEIKWQRHSGLVLLLPHGYEGQGPEHSSARLERFLQLCSHQNMQVCQPTTAAQFFHLLRRQVKVDFRKPLVVMTPKSALRSAASTSSVRELAEGRFEFVIDDASATDPERINRVVLCSGKVAHELVAHRGRSGRDDIAIVRIEQLYPFPEEQLAAVLARYGDAEVVWAQEEPRNMGAWRFMQACLRERLDLDVVGITRPANASPAAGSSKMHAQEQEKLLTEAVGLPSNVV